ncbi:hypothetical protein [Nocardiopsis sp. CNT312]|uniref:hypothetical protein n=1 Tax=Nocardiopsis sp. CNT312 TaxID=1137268 RepID=UPI00048D5B6A|nr:hypothetical protein [Nocardiopsis sp. CNT312]
MSSSTDTRRAPRRAGTGTPTTRTRPETGRREGTASPNEGRAARTAPQPSGGPARARTGRGRAPRIPFVLLILCLLGGALVSLLLLRSVIAQETFTIARLQTENRELAYIEQQLQERVSRLESSERIADEAEEMGMEQTGEAPLFLDLDNGEITGDDEGRR